MPNAVGPWTTWIWTRLICHREFGGERVTKIFKNLTDEPTRINAEKTKQ